jgi:thioredoxin 1
MPMTENYALTEPSRADIEAILGPTLLEFGAPWCSHCRASQPAIAQAFSRYPEVRHLKIEDGKGLPLGRSFKVKLWPTLVFLRDGKEVGRLVRSTDANEIAREMERISQSSET